MTQRYATSFLALLVTLLAGCELVPMSPQPTAYPPVAYPPPVVVYPTQPPPVYAYEDIRRCHAENQRAHAEVVGLYENARAAGRVNPAEAQQFNAMQARLRDLQIQMGRDRLTLQECQYISGVLASDRAEVIRMSRYDPSPARCMADNRRAHADVYRIYNDALAAGRIDSYEAQRFQVTDARLRAYQADLKRDGMSLDDCYRMAQAIARERAIVDGMARR